MSSNSRISVIIPAYNRATLIGETLESIFAQTIAPHEIIVVDDGSSDGTADVVRALDSKILVFEQENQGAGAARNFGFQKASGDLIHFMDSDDLISPNTYEAQLETLNRHKADFVYGPWVKTRFEGKTLSCQKAVVQQHSVPPTLDMYKWILRGWVTVFQPCLLSRSLIENVGPYRTDLKTSEDSELLYRIARSGATFAHCAKSLVLYRVHPSAQVSTANNLNQRLDWVRYLKSLEEDLPDNGGLDMKTDIQFGIRKVEAVQAAGVKNQDDAEQLTKTMSPSTFAIEKVSRPMRRIVNRIRRMRFGDSYTKPLMPGPMTNHQRQLIESMGFKLVD